MALLVNHPVNKARLENGKRQANSIWQAIRVPTAFPARPRTPACPAAA